MTRELFKFFDSVGLSHDELVSSAPSSLSDMAQDESEQDLFILRSDRFLRTEPKVDYSDFSNHVFFNSALDYFNITGDKILSQYPIDGTRTDLQSFDDDLDGYQRHVLSVWPCRLGHLRFDPQVSSSYVQVDDVGNIEGVTRTSILSPGTGSIVVEAWYNSGRPLTGSEQVSVLVQKQHPSVDQGYTLYLSGSAIFFRIASGSNVSQVSALAHIGTDGYVMAALDRTSVSGTMAIYTGSLAKFPVLVSSSSVSFGGPLHIGSGSMYMGSGSVSGKTTVLYSGSLDDVRMWSQPIGLSHVTSSYNRKNFSRSSMLGLWRFNETGSSGLSGIDSVVLDHSGHRLNGRVRNYHSGLRGSGSLFYESPDPILDLRCPEVLAYVQRQQTSGSDYDRANSSKITDLVPSAFLDVDSDQDADLVRNFLYILARHYDRIKLFADHLPNTLRVNYGDFDQVPDSKLEDMARFFGWELPGGFADSSAIQYMLGRDVQLGELSNDELDEKLYDVKVQFWRRTLNNLAHIYKTKGTRESVQALMRSYGVNEGFVRLKEYGYVNRHRLEAQRVYSERSSDAVQFGLPLGNLTASISVSVSPSLAVSDFSVESRIMWPSSDNSVMSASSTAGTVWGLSMVNSFDTRLNWDRSSAANRTGSLTLIINSSTGALWQDLPIFDDRWYNLYVVKNSTSGSYTLRVSRLDTDEIAYTTSSVYFTGSVGAVWSDTGSITRIVLGHTGSTSLKKNEFWTDELRVWGRALTDREMDDHCLSYRSFGSRSSQELREKMLIHWRLDDGVTADSSGRLWVTDHSLNNRVGTGSFVSGSTPFRKFLNPYNYVASPDFSWTQNKVRVYDGTSIPRDDRSVDSRLLSLEFNMIDQLNEDISEMSDSLEEMENSLGEPATVYRAEYRGLTAMRREYFRRLTDRLNFRVFVDMLDFFDRSFVAVVRRLIPARSLFMGDELVVESHMLERPKHQYSYRPIRELITVIEGTIGMLRR